MANTIKFYDLKNKGHVEIPSNKVVKKQLVNGKQTRYQIIGTTADNRQVYKFVSKADFEGKFSALSDA